jgi:hypothetical protein
MLSSGYELRGMKMKQYINLMNYHFITYARTNRFIMPLVVWSGLIFAHYRMMPLEVVSSLATSSIYVFFIMIWLGITYFDSVEVVSEQLLLLRVCKRTTYYKSKYLFLILLGALMSFLSVIVPVIYNAANNFEMFTRSLTFMDIFFGFFLHLVITFLGIAVAAIFQPLCIRNRKIALLLAAMVSLVALAKDAIIESYSFLRYLLWIFPPLSDILNLFRDSVVFNPLNIGLAIFIGTLYSLAMIIIAQLVIRKRMY